METIGLIAAMPQESNALLRYIKKWKRTALGSFQGVRFQLVDRDCLLVTSGMGIKRAMDGTRVIPAAKNPQLLISFGIAGAVKNELHIGDVVVSGNTCFLDECMPDKTLPLASLSTTAWDAAADVLQMVGSRLVTGTTITTPGSQTVSQLQQNMPNPILEMETAGIAQVAAEMGIPLLSIRSVSDGPQAPIPFDMEAMLDEEVNLRVGSMLKLILRNPKILFQLRRMMKNSKVAADHAARALIAILSQPSPILTP